MQKQHSPIVVHYTNSTNGPLLSSAPPWPGIPSSTYTLEYLNEGGANLIYKVTPTLDVPHSSTSQGSSSIQNKLLRLRKDLSHTTPTKDQYQAFNHSIAPLFPRDNLVNLDLVQLSSDLPGSINNSLSLLSGRPLHRQNDFVPVEETFGLFVTDMTPAGHDVLVQLKPKWLVQSPTAPRGAQRCRTCALRAQRASKQIRTATDAQGNCPLELVSKDIEIRRRAAEAVTDDKHIQEFLIYDAQPLLHTLRDYQQRFDRHGALKAVTEEAEGVVDLCKAMTLRDCTLFIRRPESGDRIEARLADLDLKHLEKLEKWREMESMLIDDGWYTNTEDVAIRVEEEVCLLTSSEILNEAVGDVVYISAH